MIALTLVFAAALLLGAGVLRLSGLRAEPLVLELGLGWILGSGLVGLLVFASGLMDVELTGASLATLLLACGLVGGGLWGMSRTRRPPSLGARPASPLDWVSVGAILLFIGLVLLTIATVPLTSFDARMIWSAHARLIADGAVYPPPELFDPAFVIGHPQYPPLVPLIEALALSLEAAPESLVFRAVPFAFYPATLLVLGGEVLPRERRWGWPLLAAWALMPTLVIYEEGAADAGVVDLPMGAFILAAAVILSRAFERDRLGLFGLAGVLAACAAYTKNEGLVLGVLLGVALIARAGRPRKSAAIYFATWAVFLLPWLVVRSQLAGAFEEGYLERLLAGQIALAKAPAVLWEMASRLFLAPARSGLFWWLVVGWIATAGSKRLPLVRRFGWIIGAYLVIVFGVYLISPWPGTEQVELSFLRVLLQVSPLALWAVAGALTFRGPAGEESMRAETQS